MKWKCSSNTQSGLLGISGLTNDMRVLQQELKEHDDRRVRLAIEIFCYRARKYIGHILRAWAGPMPSSSPGESERTRRIFVRAFARASNGRG